MTEQHKWAVYCAKAGKELRRRNRNQYWLKSLRDSWRINNFYKYWHRRYKRLEARIAKEKRLTIPGYGEWS